MRPIPNRSRARLRAGALLVAAAFAAPAARAQALSLAQAPLFLGNAPKPNVLVMYDRSGSMEQYRDVRFGSYPRPSTVPATSDGLYLRSHVARTILNDLIVRQYPTQFNWGFGTFEQPRSSELAGGELVTTSLGTILVPVGECASPTDATRCANILGARGIKYWLTPTSVSGAPLDDNGGTPLAGAARTALDYYRGTWIAGGARSGSTPWPGSWVMYTNDTVAQRQHPRLQRGAAPTWPSPIQQSCQKSFVIFATDGEPTDDIDPPSLQSTGTSPLVSAAIAANPIANADKRGFVRRTLNELARLRSVAGDPLADNTWNGNPYDVKTFVIGVGPSTDGGYGSPLRAALEAMADVGGTGRAFYASDGGALLDAFQSVAQSIVAQTATASAVSLNSGSWSDGTRLYQARFNSADWSGQLISYAVGSDGSLGAQQWDAGQKLKTQSWSSGRQILTYRAGATAGARGVALRWPARPTAPTAAEIAPSQVAALDADAAGTSDGLGAKRLDWLRGDASREERNCTTCSASTPALRNRPTTVLGDIVNSSPYYVAAPAYLHPAFMESVPYQRFAAANADRRPMIYVGANDGMLHGFDATTGTEVFAYVPGAAWPQLSKLTDPDYVHRYTVDGSPTVGDAFYAGAWHSLLAAPLGAGAQGVYALDVTDPESLTEAKAAQVVRWELTDADDADLGNVFGNPLVVKTNNGRWSVIVGNGYASTAADGRASASGRAFLFVIDAETGAITAKVPTGAGSLASPNGLSAPAAIDETGDGVIDTVYAGDLQGNLWKFDLRARTPSSWAPAFGGSSPQPLYATGTGRPITAAPEATRGPDGIVTVVFGTGRYLETGDNAAGGTQALYGIRDTGTSAVGAALVAQAVLGTQTGADGNSYRITTRKVADSPAGAVEDTTFAGQDATVGAAQYRTSYRGWTLALPEAGERSVAPPAIRTGRAIFTTIVPSAQVCAAGGSGWVMEIDALTGNRLAYPSFDTNRDGRPSRTDYLAWSGGTANVSGRRIASLPAAAGFLVSPIRPGQNPTEDKYLNTSSGSVEVVRETAGRGQLGRVSWEQIK